MAFGQLVRRIGSKAAKYKPKVSRFGQHVRQDISTGVGNAVRRGGDLAGKLGLNNLSKSLHANAPKLQSMAYRHPVKTALGATGVLGGLRYNKYRKKQKKNK